jgi:predicted alpha/beta superfamily hydrolase
MVERRRLALLAALAALPFAGCVRAPARVDEPAETIGDAGEFVRFAQPSRHVAAREITVWRPPGPRDAPTAVLYMHDGQNLFAPANPYNHGPWDVDGCLRRLQREGSARRTLVVGIPNAGVDRPREYLPAAAVAGFPAGEPRDVVGEGTGAPRLLSDAYLRFLVEELKPAIDARFPTRTSAADTFLAGSSMGGLISLYALARHPDVFGGAAGLSVHWPLTANFAWLGPPPQPIVATLADRWLAWLARELPKPGHHRIYVDRGTETLDALYAPWHARMVEVLAKRGYREGIDAMARVFPAADHSEEAWRARLDVPLRFLLGAGSGDM